MFFARTPFLFLLALSPLKPASAQQALWTSDLPDSSETPLRERVPQAPEKDWARYFKARPALSKMTLGVSFGGESPFQRNFSRPMLPASVEKIFTAGAALRILGAEARFENRFSGVVLPGESVLRAPRLSVSGDPTWGHEAYGETQDLENAEGLPNRLDAVIELLKQRNINRVVGPIEVESLRPALAEFSRPEGWKKSWALECMASLPTEFIAGANCGFLRVEGPGSARWLTEGVTVPVRLSLKRSREGGNNLQVSPTFDSRGRITSYRISGYIARGAVSIPLPVHQGLSWARNSLVSRLERAGIAYEEPASPPAAPVSGEKLELDLSSPPMREVLRTGVQLSLNGVMDRIFLEVGERAGADAAKVVGAEVDRIVGDAALTSGTRIVDGSGLNVFDRTRADLLVRYLEQMRSEPYFPDFLSALAVAGKSGTLLSRPVLVASSYTYGKIFAKTGTLAGVVNLAGYHIPSAGAQPQPFAVLTASSFDASRARALVDGMVVNFAGLNAGL